MKVGFLKTSLIDYPNEISSVIFFKGCNFRCVYCHNKGIVEGYDTVHELDEVLSELKSRKKYIDHVVLTGGEVLQQGKSLIPILMQLKLDGFKIKIDTNGSNPDLLSEIIEKQLVDFIAMDIKGKFIDYLKITNTFGSKEDIEKIKDSISIIESSGLPYEFRTTVFRGLHDRNILSEIERDYIKPESRYKVQRGIFVKAYIQGFEDYSEYSRVDFLNEFEGFVI